MLHGPDLEALQPTWFADKLYNAATKWKNVTQNLMRRDPAQRLPAVRGGAVVSRLIPCKDLSRRTNLAGAARQSRWVRKTDPRTGRFYYVNNVTHERRWTRPDDFDGEESDDAAGGAGAHAARRPPAPEVEGSRQSGWVELIDPGSQRYYYVNHGTRERRWRRPEGFDGSTLLFFNYRRAAHLIYNLYFTKFKIFKRKFFDSLIICAPSR